MRRLALLSASAALAGCVGGAGGGIGDGAERERTCRSAYAERLGLPMSAIEVGRRTGGADGGAVYAMQTVDGLASAACRLGADGRVLGIDAPV